MRVESSALLRISFSRPARVYDGGVQTGRGKGRRRAHGRPAAGPRPRRVRPAAAGRRGGRGGRGASAGRALGTGETRVRQDFGGETVRGRHSRLR